MPYLKKAFVPLLSLFILCYVIYFVNPPKSWQEASYLQLGLFFIPLLVFFISLANIFLKYTPASLILGLGLTFLIVLQSVNQLDILTSGGILISTAILVIFFKKTSKTAIRLTKNIEIPKLTRLGGNK